MTAVLPSRVHGPDFAAIRWDGVVYTFSPKQRAVIAMLWEAMEHGYHFVSGDALLLAADSEGGRLYDIFRGSPAWNTVIVKGLQAGGPNGCYRLAGGES